MGAAITGWGTALPVSTLANAELAERLEIDEAWIYQRTGIRQRHIAKNGETSATLGAQAARDALKVAGLDPDQIDFIIVATVTSDLRLPATACLVQAELGATGAAAYDLNAGCSGFLFALAQASALVEARIAQRVVVIGADVLSTITDYSDAKSCVLFGDGAGAVVIERQEGTPRLGPFSLHSDGSEPEHLRTSPTTGLISMDGREVYRRAVDAMASSVTGILADAKLDLDDVRLFIAHQANERILKTVAERAGLPADKVVSNIARYGNTSAASIPLALAEAVSDGRLCGGDVVVLTAFGAGFTWGAGVVRWGSWANEVRNRSALVGAHA